MSSRPPSRSAFRAAAASSRARLDECAEDRHLSEPAREAEERKKHDLLIGVPVVLAQVAKRPT